MHGRDARVMGVREAAGWAIATVYILHFGADAFGNLVLFRLHLLTPLAVATSGLVQPTLPASLLALALAGGLGILLAARLRPADVGWRRRTLGPALAFTVAAWVGMQLLLIVATLVVGGRLGLASIWSHPGPSATAGNLVAQLFGNALAEETVFRGFLLPQLVRKAEHRWGPGRRALVAGVVVSQALFALVHVPSRLLQGFGPGALALNLVVLFVIGVLFAAVYLVTDNLFIVVGLHALIDAPTPLVNAPHGIASALVLLLLLVLPFAWRPVARRITVAGAAAGRRPPG
jgi:hypothetical protein